MSKKQPTGVSNNNGRPFQPWPPENQFRRVMDTKNLDMEIELSTSTIEKNAAVKAAAKAGKSDNNEMTH